MDDCELLVGNRVVWLSDDDEPQSGKVRWIGTLPDDTSGNTTVGVEFDNKVGTCGGRYKSTRLFQTEYGYAAFIPIEELMLEEDFLGNLDECDGARLLGATARLDHMHVLSQQLRQFSFTSNEDVKRWSKRNTGTEKRPLAGRRRTETTTGRKVKVPPETWPPRRPSNLSELKVMTSVDLSLPKEERMAILAQYRSSLTSLGQRETYQMRTRKRALVHIISNETFEHFPDRMGTECDELGLKTLFQGLGCEVWTVQDLTRSEMFKHLKDLSHTDFGEYDCFMLFILSHGDKNVVYGTDGYMDSAGCPHRYVRLKKITDLFSDVPKLHGKPKLFFIQACQGNIRDKGVVVSDGSRACSGDQEDLDDAGLDEVDSTHKLPSGADVFIALSTKPGNVAFRNTKYGSWFIQAIVEVFSRYAYKDNIHALMTKVNSQLARAETDGPGYKQIMQKTDTLTKEFYLFPGLYNDRQLK